ncbi:MAG: hypothetical protein QXX83_07365 [Thermofilum sp.]
MVRGVAPLAASLLVLAITVAAVLITYLWVSSYASSPRQPEPPQIRELAKIESVEYDGSKLKVTLRNIGSAKLTVDALYVIKPGGVAVFAERGLALEVEPGASTALEVEVQLAAETYVVKLVTTTGVEVTALLSRVLARQPSQPQEPGQEPANPVFSITDWSREIVGAVASTRLFNVSIANGGRGAGTAAVKIYDHRGSPAAEVKVNLQPGEMRSLSLEISLPSARGVYSWTVKAENVATGRVDDEESFRVEARDLYLKSRSALYFTAFEKITKDWHQEGGSWSIDNGSGRSALLGKDNDKGPGGASFLYRELPPVSFLEAGVQILRGSPPPTRYGLALMSATPSSSSYTLYAVCVDYKGGDKGFRIDYYDGSSWKTVNSTSFNPAKEWYTLLVKWGPAGIEAYIYASDGSLKASLKHSPSGFNPNHVALIVDDGEAYFDNFVLATGGAGSVKVDGLQQGWRVELYSGDRLVASGTAEGSRATLNVVTDLVVLNAKIVVKDSAGREVISRNLDTVVGGDEYFYGV